MSPEPDEGPRPEAARETVDRVRRVPDRYRNFNTSEAAVTTVYGIPEAMVGALVAQGFPHREVNGRRSFDRKDLRNALLVVPSGSAQLDSLSSIADSLRRTLSGGTFSGSVDVIGKCPHRADHACDFSFQIGLTSSPHVEFVASHHLRAQVTLAAPADEHDLPSGVLGLFEELRQLRFMHLPEAVAQDLSFVENHQFADCRLAAAYALRRGADEGLAVRSATGLVVCRPFSVWHQWLEVELAAGWVAFDPFFVGALEDWGVLAQGEFAVNRSVGGAYWRLSDEEQYLMYDDGVGIDPILYTAAR